ncbi:MAG: ABC-2 transporter permease [Propionibacteriaceae bacterium]|jgi:hypothetical protein|nr:ABC-2 transporter permease [Propionibacteriaceae bacterium]
MFSPRQIWRFVRLDGRTVRPYLQTRTLLLSAAMALGIGVATREPVIAAAMPLFMATTYLGYPFLAGERSDMDALYVTWSIPGRTVVLGRYGFSFGLNLVALLVAAVFATPIAWWQWAVPAELAPALLTLFGMVIVVNCLQLPVYFKLGYTKAKGLVYVPLLAIMAIIVLVVGFADRLRWTAAVAALGPWSLAIIGVVVVLAGAAGSVMLSMRFYRAREF